jgi:amidase
MPWTETPAYGATRNPWDLDRTPGGSSGGSAAAVAAGLVPAATASDGAGSIRIPAGASGLFGLKPQRGRVPEAPKGSEQMWHGLSVYGFVTRTVADSALLHDVVNDGGPSFADAAAREPGKLRIALSTRIPRPIVARVDAEQHRAISGMADRLRALGHDVVERDPDYGTVFTRVVTRYLRGIHDDAESLPESDRLTRMTRGLVRMGAAIPGSLLAKALEAEEADRARINALFEHVDLLLTPMFTRRPTRVFEYEGRGGQWSVNAAARIVPFLGVWNHLGQPAMSVPAGYAPDGFPLAAHFAAPPDGEPMLVSLAAQLEREIGWPERRPEFAS